LLELDDRQKPLLSETVRNRLRVLLTGACHQRRSCMPALKAAIMLLTLSLAHPAIGQIHVTPSQPGPDDPLRVTIDSVAGGAPAEVVASSYDVLPGLIRIDATVEVGPFSYPAPYSVELTIPPVQPGAYEVQYWSTYIEGGVTGPTLEWTAFIEVRQAIPVPTLGLSALVALAALLGAAGVAAIRRWSA
jgi:hypothetical protein